MKGAGQLQSLLEVSETCCTAGPSEQLREKVAAVILELHGVVAGFGYLKNALACYTPIVPPRFLHRTQLGPDERARAFVHELCNAALHPPGSADVAEHEDLAEERCAHEAAGRICRSHGVDDYRATMASHGVVVEPTQPDDEALISRMVDSVSAALRTPGLASTWGRDGADGL